MHIRYQQPCDKIHAENADSAGICCLERHSRLSPMLSSQAPCQTSVPDAQRQEFGTFRHGAYVIHIECWCVLSCRCCKQSRISQQSETPSRCSATTRSPLP